MNINGQEKFIDWLGDKKQEERFNKAMETYPIKHEDEIVEQVICCGEFYPIREKDQDKPFICPVCKKVYNA